MDADWIKSPGARRMFAHWADPRPAWLWSADGTRLIWRNPAAGEFARTRGREGGKRAAEATPIEGQVARILRLTPAGQTMPSQVQFMVGSKPVGLTCRCTPLPLPSGSIGLLLVAKEPVLLGPEALRQDDAQSAGIFADGAAWVLVGEDTDVLAGSASGREKFGATAELARYPAGPAGEMLVLFGGATALTGPAPAPEKEAAAGHVDHASGGQASPDQPVEVGEEARRSLSALFDRLADDAQLYASLEESAAPAPEAPDPHPPQIDIHLKAEEIGAAAPDLSLPEPLIEEGTESRPPPDAEALERVSRYNFDELSRILKDRIGRDEARSRRQPAGPHPASALRSQPAGETAPLAPDGQLVNLAGETFILNRLPLGILVIRDQQVLFANRAIVEALGYGSVDELRTAGLASILPGSESGMPDPGPVSHLVKRTGGLVPVVARLQSISWQGRPAAMLSASVIEARVGHEAAVRTFAELVAQAQDEGFIEADRNGVVAQASARARFLLGNADRELEGLPLSAVIEAGQGKALQAFLEQPARFAETTRPWVSLRGAGGADVLLFALGQAGIVTGYFGMIRKPRVSLAVPLPRELEPEMVAQFSRGVRRPLNTIIGFADLIHSAAFGHVGNERYLEYSRDIRSAGEEIAMLIDELEDLNRLKEGRYTARPVELDLGPLLDSSILRVRPQAAAARILVRSAVSEKLPRIRADRPSLGQAVLNLLASAIDQTPPGGSVILSAHVVEDGSITINVRDTGAGPVDQGERFVVFRDSALAGNKGPVRSTVGLALTRSLLAVNDCSLSVDPIGKSGTLFSLTIPGEAIVGKADAAAE